jgi:peptide-methionine (S)-S-oxide reductase
MSTSTSNHAPSHTAPPSEDRITLGAGCFWCTEAVFLRVPGVLHVESGYCNGHFDSPTYEQVCTGQSGHVEVISLRFDPTQVSLTALLAIFLGTHDPTTLNRQGHDVGPQYRSGIYWHRPEQAEVARAVLAAAQPAFAQPIVTEVVECLGYSRAEGYHQNYYAQNPQQGYCRLVIPPKLEKLKTLLARA